VLRNAQQLFFESLLNELFLVPTLCVGMRFGRSASCKL